MSGLDVAWGRQREIRFNAYIASANKIKGKAILVP